MRRRALLSVLLLGACASPPSRPPLEWIRVEGDRFVLDPSGRRFTAWGVNYDHDGRGRLIEDYWEGEWPTVVEDFREIRGLGANVVRVHLQVAKFMDAPDRPNAAALARLKRLLRLAEETGLYLDLTGLGCYHRKDVPEWYDALDEAGRWGVQARFWEAVAGACRESPAVFCYDLMNEPILPGKKREKDWLAGELGGKHFVQRLSLDLAGRTREQVVQAWVERMVAAIRRRDPRHLVTVGVIPWAYTFKGAKPLFYGPETGARLDFVSVHFYPKKADAAGALEALAAYDVGKPLVIEETFPLKCGLEEMDRFLDGSREIADGWISFYWGQTAAECEAKGDFAGVMMARWLRHFRTRSAEFARP